MLYHINASQFVVQCFFVVVAIAHAFCHRLSAPSFLSSNTRKRDEAPVRYSFNASAKRRHSPVKRAAADGTRIVRLAFSPAYRITAGAEQWAAEQALPVPLVKSNGHQKRSKRG